MKPGVGFWSAKDALRVALNRSSELRFWFMRPANLPDEADDRLRSDPAAAPITPLDSGLDDMVAVWRKVMDARCGYESL